MTADVTNEKREACFAAGMDGFLGKPLDRGEMGRALAEVEKTAAPGSPDSPFPRLFDAAAGDAAVFASLLAQARLDLIDGGHAVKAALRAKDLPAVARGAHSVKSVAGLLDAAALRDQCQETQAAADAGDLAGAVRAFLPLYARLHDTVGALDTALADAPPAPAAPALAPT